MKILLPILLFAALASFLGLSFSDKIAAAPPPQDKTKVRLHILPLECVLEKINNGINDIHSLTPADCKKKIKSIPRSPFNEPDGEVFAVPLSPTEDSFNIENPRQNPSEISIEDQNLNISLPISGGGWLARIINLVLQTTVGILLLLFTVYIFIKRFFGFL